MNEETKPSVMPLLIFGLIGWLIVSTLTGGKNVTPEPVDPVPVVASEHLTASLEYSAALQQHIKATITKLQAGELTDEVQTRDWLKAGREASLKAAWMPVAERDAVAFVDGWTVEKQIARLQALIAPGAGN